MKCVEIDGEVFISRSDIVKELYKLSSDKGTKKISGDDALVAMAKSLERAELLPDQKKSFFDWLRGL